MFGQRALLLIPHPDDELVGMAASIERMRSEGSEIFAAYLTSGVPANAGILWGGQSRYDAYVARRWSEASNVARALGISMVGRRAIASRELKSHLASSLEWIRDEAAALAPDRIWVPAYEGGHQDHDVTNFIGAQLANDYDVWEFAEYNFSGGKVRGQTFVNPNGTESTFALDDAERTRKRELLRRYASEQRNLGYVRFEQESFRPIAEYDYDQPPHEGRCFYERFQWFPFHPRIDYCRPDQVCEALGSRA